jgi:hypothetical protein
MTAISIAESILDRALEEAEAGKKETIPRLDFATRPVPPFAPPFTFSRSDPKS